MKTRYVKTKKNQASFDVIHDGKKIGTAGKVPLSAKALDALIEKATKPTKKKA